MEDNMSLIEFELVQVNQPGVSQAVAAQWFRVAQCWQSTGAQTRPLTGNLESFFCGELPWWAAVSASQWYCACFQFEALWDIIVWAIVPVLASCEQPRTRWWVLRQSKSVLSLQASKSAAWHAVPDPASLIGPAKPHWPVHQAQIKMLWRNWWTIDSLMYLVLSPACLAKLGRVSICCSFCSCVCMYTKVLMISTWLLVCTWVWCCVNAVSTQCHTGQEALQKAGAKSSWIYELLQIKRSQPMIVIVSIAPNISEALLHFLSL